MIRAAIDTLRRVDHAIGRRSGRRRILVDARTPVNFTMVAPVYRALAATPREMLKPLVPSRRAAREAAVPPARAVRGAVEARA